MPRIVVMVDCKETVAFYEKLAIKHDLTNADVCAYLLSILAEEPEIVDNLMGEFAESDRARRVAALRNKVKIGNKVLSLPVICIVRHLASLGDGWHELPYSAWTKAIYFKHGTLTPALKICEDEGYLLVQRGEATSGIRATNRYRLTPAGKEMASTLRASNAANSLYAEHMATKGEYYVVRASNNRSVA